MKQTANIVQRTALDHKALVQRIIGRLCRLIYLTFQPEIELLVLCS